MTPLLGCSLTYVPFFVFFFFLHLSNTPLSLYSTHFSPCLSVCLRLLSSISHPQTPPSVWMGRASPLVSWLPSQSGQPWRRPTGPLLCLTPACSSTSRPWPACSFSSRLLFSHQVWTTKKPSQVLSPPSGCLDPSKPASAMLEEQYMAYVVFFSPNYKGLL